LSGFLGPKKEPAAPSVSTETAPRIPEGFSKARFNLSLWWRGRLLTREMGPEFLASYTDRIQGKLRELAAAYLILRDGNCCTIRSALCTQGNAPFERPSGADFDHIDGKKPPNQRVGNLRLACHSCNSHVQSMRRFEWNSEQAITTAQPRERKLNAPAQPQASSLETAKHDPERAAWEEAIQNQKLWSELKMRGCLATEWGGNTFYTLQDVCDIAVKYTVDRVFGKYSAQTFAKYAGEDRFDILEMVKLGGRWWVRLVNPIWQHETPQLEPTKANTHAPTET
jgi:hypothetical protein